MYAVPNFSAGPSSPALGEIGAALRASASVLDMHSDDVHNRSVFSVAATPDYLGQALEDGAAAAIAGIDLREHAGAHPRIGALDVCPVVFTADEDESGAGELARSIGARFGERGLPVFLYGALAADEQRRERHHFRAGGFESLAGRMGSGELTPDFGPAQPHPSAGAVLVTARRPLAAFNVELGGIGIEQGREIAAGLRESGGGMAGVRAIAIRLDDGRVQISTNVHDPATTTLAAVVAEIARLAEPYGGVAEAGELIGLVPEAALRDYPESVPIRDFDPARRTIEARLGDAR